MADAENSDASILLVDDDPLFTAEMVQILEDEELPVCTFESAAHAIRHMQSRPWSWNPRLIITDIVMDGIGGYQLMRRITELYPTKNIPIIVVSRLYSADYVYEAEVAGASCFLQKPVTSQKLLAAIQKYIKKS